MMPLGRVWDHQCDCKVSRKSLDNSMWYSDYPFTHHSLPSGTQTINIHITVSLVVLRLPHCTSASPCWYPDYPYTHHSLPGVTQTISILNKVCFVILRLSLYTSQSARWYSDYPWWYSDYTYTHHSLTGGT